MASGAVCAGVAWGLCAPTLGSLRADRVLAAAVITVPLALLLSLTLHSMLARALERRGVPTAEAAGRARWVFAPGWIAGFSPLSLILPSRSLPLFLFFVATSLVLYRLCVLASSNGFLREPRRLEWIVFFSVFVAAWIALFQVNIVHDAFQYYGYLTSAVLDGDLDLYDQIYIHNTDRFYNPFPAGSGRYMGTAVLEAPFFALGHLTTLLLNHLGGFQPPNGYSLPYRFFVSLASSLFGFAGLILCYHLARDFFPRTTSMMAALAVALASPLVFFMFCWNGWPHPFAFCFASAFLLTWHRTREDRGLAAWMLLGALGGGLVLIRPPSALIFLFPLAEWLLKARRFRALAAPRRELLCGPLLATSLALAVFSPQLSLWKVNSGAWLSAPYREVGDRYDWLHPNLGVLFSTAQHGLFTWTPLLLLATVGLAALWRRDRMFALASTLVVAGTFYTYASWSIWWSGVGFSNRFFIELTPLFVAGLAAVIDLARRRISRECIWGVLAFAIAWNLVLVLDYRGNILPQGIPDPYRVVDEPLRLGSLVASNLRLESGTADEPVWGAWVPGGFFSERLGNALVYGNASGLYAGLAGLGVAAALALAVLGLTLGARLRWRGLRAATGILAAGLGTTVLLHGTIAFAARRGAPRGEFFRFKETSIHAQQWAEDIELYPDYPLPVTAMDLLTFLVYGHAIPQGTPVASVTVYDDDAREVTQILRAGIETAETSYLRPEYREAIRHDISKTDVVRTSPTHVYSDRAYDLLTFRSALELPRPMVVRRVRIRYLGPSGRLVISDLFLRDS